MLCTSWWNMVEYGGVVWFWASKVPPSKIIHTHTQKSLYLESTSCFFVDVQCATHPLNIHKTCDCMTQYLMDTVAVGCSIRMRVSPPKNNLYQLILPAYTYVYIGFPNYDNGSKDVGSVTCNFGCYSESMWTPLRALHILAFAPLSAVLIRYEVLASLRLPGRKLFQFLRWLHVLNRPSQGLKRCGTFHLTKF